MSTYYATKNYVVRLTEAINEELRSVGSHVYVGAFCPGPVDTNFNKTAGVKFAVKGIPAGYAAVYAVKGMMDRKMIIVPTALMKTGLAAARFVPDPLLVRATRFIQTKRRG